MHECEKERDRLLKEFERGVICSPVWLKCTIPSPPEPTVSEFVNNMIHNTKLSSTGQLPMETCEQTSRSVIVPRKTDFHLKPDCLQRVFRDLKALWSCQLNEEGQHTKLHWQTVQRNTKLQYLNSASVYHLLNRLTMQPRTVK